MTKLIFALHGPDLAPTLLSAAFREHLAAAGAHRLQVNLDDAEVAPAMRFGPGRPITAFVTVWTDGDPGAVTDVLVGLQDDVHGWTVTERRPLEPVPVPDGERAAVLANVAVLRRPDTLTREQYLDIWLTDHTPVAIATQNTSGYIQNVVEEALTPASPEISAIVEEHFEMAGMHDPHAFYGSGGDDAELNRRITALMTSVERFGAGTGLDLVPTSRYLWELT